MTPEQVDALIEEIAGLMEDMSRIRLRRAEIRFMLEPGRYEGTEKDLVLSPASEVDTYSLPLLRKHVPASLLERCVVKKRITKRLKLADKLKPRKEQQK